MKKMMKLIAVLVGMAMLISACGSGSNSAAATQTASAQTTTGMNADTPLSARLAIGTLELEDTELAVTAEQAKTLLPLWKAVRSMSSSDTATQAEIQAIYDQIQEAMTAEQIAAIEAVNMTPEEMTALMTKLGIEPGQFGGGNMANLTEDQRATQIAQFQAQGGVIPGGADGPTFNFSGGERPSGGSGGNSGSSFTRPGGGGGAVGGGGGMPSGGMVFSGDVPADGVMEITPGAGVTRRFNGGMNQMFIEPLIKLLEERSAS
jgi:hypothetical protein